MTRTLPVFFLGVVAMCPRVRVVGIEMVHQLLRVKPLRRGIRSASIVNLGNGGRLDLLFRNFGSSSSSLAGNGCQQVSATAAFSTASDACHDGSHENEQSKRYRWAKSWMAIPPRLIEGRRRRRRRGRVITTRRVVVLDAAVANDSALLLHLGACLPDGLGYLTGLSSDIVNAIWSPGTC